MLCIRRRLRAAASRAQPVPTITTIYRPQSTGQSQSGNLSRDNTSAAGGREVLVVGVRPAPTPRPADRRERADTSSPPVEGHAGPDAPHDRRTPSPRPVARRRLRRTGSRPCSRRSRRRTRAPTIAAVRGHRVAAVESRRVVGGHRLGIAPAERVDGLHSPDREPLRVQARRTRSITDSTTAAFTIMVPVCG